jgi:hypothetical protein
LLTITIGACCSWLARAASGSSRPRWAWRISPVAENTISRNVTRIVIMSTNGVRLSDTFDARPPAPAFFARCSNLIDL